MEDASAFLLDLNIIFNRKKSFTQYVRQWPTGKEYAGMMHTAQRNLQCREARVNLWKIDPCQPIVVEQRGLRR
jgi:hypothetical protein